MGGFARQVEELTVFFPLFTRITGTADISSITDITDFGPFLNEGQAAGRAFPLHAGYLHPTRRTIVVRKCKFAVNSAGCFGVFHPLVNQTIFEDNRPIHISIAAFPADFPAAIPTAIGQSPLPEAGKYTRQWQSVNLSDLQFFGQEPVDFAMLIADSRYRNLAGMLMRE